MAKFVVTGQRLWFGTNKLSQDTDAIVLEYATEAQDTTCIEEDTRVMTGGLKTVQLQANGYVDYSSAEPYMFNQIGVDDTPISVANSNDVGAVAYFFNATAGGFNPGAGVGEALKFSFSAFARGRLVRGVLGSTGTKTSSGTNTGAQLGAVGASQKLYAQLHVISSSGSGDQTLDVKITSDDNAGFTSATDRITFTQATTAATFEVLDTSGAIADDYFRVEYTVGGTGSPTFDFAVVLGVL